MIIKWFKKVLPILRAGLGIGLLAYVLLTTEGWQAVGHLVTHPYILLGLALLPLLGAAIESLRMGLLFRSQGIDLPFTYGYQLVAIGTFFNFAVPGGTGGDVMKLYYLAARNRGLGIEVAMVLLVDRIVALFALLCLIIGLALLNRQLVEAHLAVRWLVIAALVGLLGLLAIAAVSFSRSVRASRLYVFLMSHLPLHRYLARAADALYTFRHHKRALLGAALWSLLGHFALAFMFMAVGTVLMPEASRLVLALLALLGMLANALPITPGGVGVGEAAFDRLFQLIGFTNGAILLVSWRISMLPLFLIGSALFVAGLRQGHKLDVADMTVKGL